jgi:glycosyltransferase involved in cell wall biosynthesis
MRSWIWQYVPHLHGHGGVNSRLPSFMGWLKRLGRRQVVITHEIAADYSWHPGRLWYAWNHRRQRRKILRFADVIPISTSRWVEDRSARRPDAAKKFFTLASPSSIPRDQTLTPEDRIRWRREHRLPENAKIITGFGTFSPAKGIPGAIDGWCYSLRANQPVAFVLIGSAPEIPLASDLRALYRPLGYIKPQEVSRARHAADVMALPFTDGYSERRTTLMAALDHGVAVATTTGHNTGSALQKADWAAHVPAADRNGYIRLMQELVHVDEKRRPIAAAGKAHHDREFSWPAVVQRLRERLTAQGKQPRSVQCRRENLLGRGATEFHVAVEESQIGPEFP